MAAGVLVPLFLFGCIFGVIYIFLTTRNKERLALIEKGTDASLFKMGFDKRIYGIISLHIALLAIGIGIGVLLGNMLENSGMDDDTAYPAMIFICGGIGLLAGFFISRKLLSKV